MNNNNKCFTPKYHEGREERPSFVECESVQNPNSAQARIYPQPHRCWKKPFRNSFFLNLRRTRRNYETITSKRQTAISITSTSQSIAAGEEGNDRTDRSRLEKAQPPSNSHPAKVSVGVARLILLAHSPLSKHCTPPPLPLFW